MKVNIITYIFMFNILCIIVFSNIYNYILPSNFQPLHQGDKLIYLDFLFYAVTIQSGIGLPDVTAISNLAKILVLIQQLMLMASTFILMHVFYTSYKG